MKAKLTKALLGLLLTLSVISANASISDPIFGKKPTTADVLTDEQKGVRLENIRLRAEEIRAMDKTALSRSDRKALKKELRTMNREAREMRGGVYLSVGAIIIIVLLLVLLL